MGEFFDLGPEERRKKGGFFEEGAGGFFEEGAGGFFEEGGERFFEAFPSFLRSSEPKIEDPPSSIFGAEDRRTPHLQSSIFGAENRRTPLSKTEAQNSEVSVLTFQTKVLVSRLAGNLSTQLWG